MRVIPLLSCGTRVKTRIRQNNEGLKEPHEKRLTRGSSWFCGAVCALGMQLELLGGALRGQSHGDRDRDSVPEPGPAGGTQGAHLGTDGPALCDCPCSLFILLPEGEWDNRALPEAPKGM